MTATFLHTAAMGARPGAGRVGGGVGFGGLVLVAVALVALPAGAQSLNIGSAGDDSPIEIFADDGIEWQQENQLFIARGNAKAVRGDIRVLADELRAYYREKPDGGTHLVRLDAVGTVQIKSPTETAYGDQAVYNVRDSILVLTGENLRLIAGEDEITAERQLEYWDAKRMAVARGNAFARRRDKRLRADILAAYFREDEKGETRVYRVDAFDRVEIVTAKDTAVSDRGVYNVESGIATLTGSVKIVRGRNVLRGCRAEVNLNTGISNLYSCGAGQGGNRVRGVLQPGLYGKRK